MGDGWNWHPREHRGHRRHCRGSGSRWPRDADILDALNGATFHQQFLDQFFTAEIGAAVNDQTALLFAGETTPEDAAAAITAAAGG